MPAKTEELTLIYRHEQIRFDGSDVAILQCETPEQTPAPDSQLLAFVNPPVIVKCECPPDELITGLSYRFYGHWMTHHKYGQQFQARTYVRCQPHGRGGIIRYLLTTCAGCGMGKATAEKMWEKFKSDAVRILREEPEVAAAAVGMQHFTAEKAVAAAAVLKEESALEAVSIDVIDLLGGRGFPKDTPKKCIDKWGNRTAVLLKKNPYLLMLFRGCGFGLTDKMYLDMGGNPAALKRQALCAWNAVARDTDGHTWYRPEFVEMGLRGKIGGTLVRPIDAMKLAKRAGALSVFRDADNKPWVAEAKKAANERTIAEHVLGMMAEPSRWPEATLTDLTEHQQTQLAVALKSSVCVLAGSPGTGKTFTIARLIGRIIELCGPESIAVCAPTGKAAVRITQALDSYGIRKSATTIHRLLGVASRTAGEGWGFAHDENNPLLQNWIIVDEASMIDTDLMAGLLRACGTGTHLLLVGDVNQLPPVGHGAPLRDLILAGIPTGELTKIERNWGTIVQACADIRDGKKWQTVKSIDPDQGHNLKLLPAASGLAAVETIVETIRKIKATGIADPVWDVQVIVAVNKKSDLSRKALNARLQGELNPNGQRVGNNPFRVGDKIVCLKNSLMPAADNAPSDANRDIVDGKIFVANGELARVVSVAEKLTTVSLESPKRLVKIPRGTDNGDGDKDESDDSASAGGTGCSWDLAYAISCHKSQGSEFPIVIVALDEYLGSRRVCSREWLYTAISRAKMICFLVGKRHIADGMCSQRAISKRKTFLKELIHGMGEREGALS